MRRTVSLFLFINFCVLIVFAKGPELLVTAVNNLNIDRSKEMVTLNWKDLNNISLSNDPAKISIVTYGTGEELVSQVIDNNQDGTPDELVFIADFSAGEEKRFVIKSSDAGSKLDKSFTDARYMLPRQDVVWENDRIAFRIYGPAFAHELNNGIDVWVKRVRYPIIEKWYKGDEADSLHRISYHEDHGEGGDFFNVYRSLGAGGCALYKDDSLYQPGVFENYKIIATGPIRSIFEVTYKPVKYKGRFISEIKRITLDAGNNLNKIEVMYKCDSSAGPLSFAAGIVKRKGVTSYKDKKNTWVSLWGLIDEKEENGSLGTGIVMTKKMLPAIKEDAVHVLVLGTAEVNKPAVYYAGAGWTRSGDFNNAGDWNNYIREYLSRLENPIKLTINKRID